MKFSCATVPVAADISTPPRPAIAAEIMKTLSFSRTRFWPSIAEAAGLSFIAASRRPYPLLRRAASPTAISANRTVAVISDVVPSRRSRGPTLSGGMTSDPSGNSVNVIPNSSCSVLSRSTMFDRNSPNAIVARARYRPRSRSAGSATSPPTIAAAATASSTPWMFIRASRPVPTTPAWNATTVATAPNASGARFSSPA